MSNRSIEVIIERIGAPSRVEREAWSNVIQGTITIVLCRLMRKMQKTPSYYGNLTATSLKKRIKENLVTSMLKLTAAVQEICNDSDYPGVE